MKINDLVSPELPGIVIRTLQGLLTEKDCDYLKKNFDLDIQEIWFCDDGSLELENIDPNSDDMDLIDLSEQYLFELIDGLSNYQEAAYYTLLAHAASQLPTWVYDNNKFLFNWELFSDLTLEDFTIAYRSAWDMIFDGKPRSSAARTTAEAAILTSMTEKLPQWLNLGQPQETATTRKTFPISVEVLELLANTHQRLNPAELKPSLSINSASTDDHYVSPFTGKSI